MATKTVTGKTLYLHFSCDQDSSQSYVEQDVPISKECGLIGKRNVSVTKRFTHIVETVEGALITVVKDKHTGAWYVVDEAGNYDPKWKLTSDLALEKARFFQGLIIRGILVHATEYTADKKYCKKVDSNREMFFTRENVPIMTAKRAVIQSGGSLAVRGAQ